LAHQVVGFVQPPINRAGNLATALQHARRAREASVSIKQEWRDKEEFRLLSLYQRFERVVVTILKTRWPRHGAHRAEASSHNETMRFVHPNCA
jgi:hypothetical protein